MDGGWWQVGDNLRADSHDEFAHRFATTCVMSRDVGDSIQVAEHRGSHQIEMSLDSETCVSTSR
jgi:hypothetical protein